MCAYARSARSVRNLRNGGGVQSVDARGASGRSDAACCSQQQGIGQQSSMMCLVHGMSERAVRGPCALLRGGVAARAARTDSIGGRAGWWHSMLKSTARQRGGQWHRTMSCSMLGMAARGMHSARVVLRSGIAARAPRASSVGGRQREAQSSRCARGAHHDCDRGLLPRGSTRRFPSLL